MLKLPEFAPTPEGAKYKREFIRGVYETPNSSEVAELLEENLKPGNMFKVMYEENGGWSVDWVDPKQKEADVAVFNEIFNFLWKHMLSDDETLLADLPALKQILEQSPLYEALKTVKSGGIDKPSTFDHILDVLKRLKTDGMNVLARFLSRMEAIWHDVGKIIGLKDVAMVNILSGDYIQLHAILTGKLWQTYSTTMGFVGAPTELVTEILVNHHILEQVDKGILTINEVAHIISPAIAMYLAGLSIADAQASHPGLFDHVNYKIAAELLQVQSLDELDPKVKNMLALYFPATLEAIFEQVELAERKGDTSVVNKLLVKLQAFVEVLLELPIVEEVKRVLDSLQKKHPIPFSMIVSNLRLITPATA